MYFVANNNGAKLCGKRVSLLSKSDKPTVVIACEVLDNLPHDKIRRSSDGFLLEHAMVHIDEETNSVKETYAPLSDPLIQRVVNTVPSYANQRLPSWIPSVACGVLDHVIRQRRNLSLVMADFNWLPPPDSPKGYSLNDGAVGQPLVTDMDGIDYASYVQAPPLCDILFPTDFEKLASFIARVENENRSKCHNDLAVNVETQSEFLQRMGAEEVRATKSWFTGYTPLLHDFSNCSVISVERRNR